MIFLSHQYSSGGQDMGQTINQSMTLNCLSFVLEVWLDLMYKFFKSFQTGMESSTKPHNSEEIIQQVEKHNLFPLDF